MTLNEFFKMAGTLKDLFMKIHKLAIYWVWKQSGSSAAGFRAHVKFKLVVHPVHFFLGQRLQLKIFYK